MKKVKMNIGITLISLIITIIVLLILTGVAIVTLTGENGILNRAKVAKETTEEKTIEEQDRLSQYENGIDSYAGVLARAGSNVEYVVAWSGTNNSGDVSLGDYDLFDYDYIVLTARYEFNKINQTSINSIGALQTGDNIGVYNDSYYTYYTITNSNTLTRSQIQSKHYNYLIRVELIKFK